MRIMLVLGFLFLITGSVYAEDYTAIAQKIETIKTETIALQQMINKLNHNNSVSASALSITDIINNINNLLISLQTLANTTSSEVSTTGETVRTSIASLTIKMEQELNKLNNELTTLIKSTDTTLQTVNTTIQHVDTATRNTINFIDSIGGRVSSSYYLGSGGLDSSAELILWKDASHNSNPQYSFLRFSVDGLDNPSNREYSIIGGTTRGILSFGAGYIQDGFGLDFGLNNFGTHGFDNRTSLYRMSDLGLNTEFGYRLNFLKGTRLFIFGEDLLNKEERTGGGGICYERPF